MITDESLLKKRKRIKSVIGFIFCGMGYYLNLKREVRG